MALQIVKQDDGYHVIADVVVPQTVEHIFATVEEAVSKFKELESGVAQPAIPADPAAPEDVVEPGV